MAPTDWSALTKMSGHAPDNPADGVREDLLWGDQKQGISELLDSL